MRKIPILILFLFLGNQLAAQIAATVRTPDAVYAELFTQVQMEKVFPDGKTFVDCVPKRKPQEILADFRIQKGKPGFP